MAVQYIFSGQLTGSRKIEQLGIFLGSRDVSTAGRGGVTSLTFGTWENSDKIRSKLGNFEELKAS